LGKAVIHEVHKETQRKTKKNKEKQRKTKKNKEKQRKTKKNRLFRPRLQQLLG